MIRRLILFLVLGGMLIGCACAEAYATYYPTGSSGQPYMRLYGGEINDPYYLASHIIYITSETDSNITNRVYWTEQNVFVPYENGWMFDHVYHLLFHQGYLNFTDKHIYMQNTGTNGLMKFDIGVGAQNTKFSNCSVTGFDQIQGNSIYLADNITDTNFVNWWYIGIIDIPSRHGLSYEISNCTFTGGESQIGLGYQTGLNGSIFHDLTYTDVQSSMFVIPNSTNTTLYNVTANGTIPDDSGTAVYFAGASTPALYDTCTGGHDNSAYNIYLNGTGRSGFDLSQYEYNFTGENLTVYYSGHNGFDLHGQWNVTLRNCTVGNSRLENFMITSPNADAGDAYIHDKTGAVNDRALTTVSHDIFIYDLLIDCTNESTAGSDLSFNRYVNVLVENVTVFNSKKFGNINYGENLTIINATGTNVRDSVAINLGTTATEYGYCNDTKLIDCHFSSPSYNPILSVYDSRNTTVINSYFEGGIVRGSSEPPNDATVYYYPNLRVENLLGQPVADAAITINTTARNGYGVVQTTFLTDEDGTLYDSGNRSNWLSVPDYYTYFPTLTSTYYNSEITATKSGEIDSVIVNPDISWYSADPSDLQGSEIVLILDVQGVATPVAEFSADVTSGTVPLTVQFTDLSENALSWYWDFDNDGVYDSTVQNSTYKYKSKGNYTVKLVVSNANNTDVETKTAYITVTGTSPAKRITHSVYGYFYNMFYQIFGLGAWL